jgi:exodeoxyribonuclease VII large subunit
VPLHVGAAREALGRGSARLARHGRRAVADRARVLARLSRAPGEHVARHRRELHQDLRELRASARRRVDAEEAATARRAEALARRAAAAAGPLRTSRERRLDGLAAALAAHDPERTLARGYALVEDAEGAPVTDAGAARAAREVRIRFADGAVQATLKDET